jgi:ATP-dependent protease ClpP protease subunit
MIRALTLVAGLVLGCQAPSVEAKTLTLKTKRYVELIGAVRGDAVELAQKIDKLSAKSDADIYFLINSPGGAVGPGMAVVDSMVMAKKRGVTFKCAVGVLAASMAFIILSECQERYALPNAKLLFHPISLSTPGSRVQELILNLDTTKNQEYRIMGRLKDLMGLGWKDFHRNYFAETSWSATELANYTKRAKFLTIVDRIEKGGENLFKYRKPGFSIFGGKQNTNRVVQEIIKRYEGANR